MKDTLLDTEVIRRYDFVAQFRIGAMGHIYEIFKESEEVDGVSVKIDIYHGLVLIAARQERERRFVELCDKVIQMRKNEMNISKEEE